MTVGGEDEHALSDQEVMRQGWKEMGLRRQTQTPMDTAQIRPQTQKQSFIKIFLPNWMKRLNFYTLQFLWLGFQVIVLFHDPVLTQPLLSDRWPHMCLYNVLVHWGAYGQSMDCWWPPHMPNTHFSMITATSLSIHRQTYTNLGRPDTDKRSLSFQERNKTSSKILLLCLVVFFKKAVKHCKM